MVSFVFTSSVGVGHISEVSLGRCPRALPVNKTFLVHVGPRDACVFLSALLKCAARGYCQLIRASGQDCAVFGFRPIKNDRRDNLFASP